MTAGFLLDTSVLSALAPGKPAPAEALANWLQRHSDRLYVSAITVAEVEQGICKLRRSGGSERADRLSQWLERLIDQATDRILSFDPVIARVAGELSDKAQASGRHPGFADIAIAATAKAHDLLVLTRNSRHFEPLDVAFTDPFEQLPAT